MLSLFAVSYVVGVLGFFLGVPGLLVLSGDRGSWNALMLLADSVRYALEWEDGGRLRRATAIAFDPGTIYLADTQTVYTLTFVPKYPQHYRISIHYPEGSNNLSECATNLHHPIVAQLVVRRNPLDSPYNVSVEEGFMRPAHFSDGKSWVKGMEWILVDFDVLGEAGWEGVPMELQVRLTAPAVPPSEGCRKGRLVVYAEPPIDFSCGD